MELVKINNKILENNLKEIVNKSKKERISSLNEFNKRTREITTCLRGQARTQEENANIIKEQYNQIQKIYTSKVKTLTEQLKIISDKCQLLESRKNLDIEGYINEIGLMRKRLKSYQDYAQKIQNMSSYKPIHVDGYNNNSDYYNNYEQNEQYNGTRSLNQINEQDNEHDIEQRNEEIKNNNDLYDDQHNPDNQNYIHN